ncbi:MAG: hypothetical protein M3337_06435 [Actinomycetota bacterium]|nr:hypothetical protein [Actinomycetota bacterium]
MERSASSKPDDHYGVCIVAASTGEAVRGETMMDTTTSRRRLRALGAGIAVTAGSLSLPAATPSAAAPYCGIEWGSLAKDAPDQTPASITNVRAGRHRCFDRLVIDIGTDFPDERGSEGYSIKYVRRVTSEPSGRPVRLDGGAFIDIYVRAPVVSNEPPYERTYDPRKPRRVVDVTGFRTFRQVTLAGTHEGITQFGLGVRARLPFRVFVLDGPGDASRVVIDVAHRW